MFKMLKLTCILAITLLLVLAFAKEHCRIVVLESILEGLVGGIMVGLVQTLSILEQLRHRQGLALRQTVSTVFHEACTGIVGGLFVGVVFALLILVAK